MSLHDAEKAARVVAARVLAAGGTSDQVHAAYYAAIAAAMIQPTKEN